jgi:predicted nuclease of predicted toxin-antitoxin system
VNVAQRSITLLIDVNLSPDWADALAAESWDAVHWSSIGDPRATDDVLMGWARENDRVVFTHDLDFGTLLALSHASGPSVVQVRARNVLPDHLSPIVVAALEQHEADLATGAIVVVDESSSRVRVLPL